ncbi:MAG TPA: argininosuccinate synthase domain-containing protein [Solirubrobacteraceae bacterium]|jgi:argininosuccinate synthase|nr:argininosuccinate synthase domain-containing protein [Solirubrobacteraceae bacterium]
MPGRHFVLAFSGGLDTSYGLAVLVDRGEQVTTVTVNTGGFDADELRDIETRAQALGASEHVVVDGRARLFHEFVSYILKANYLRNGVYPSCVGVERMLQAEEVTRVALQRGADAIAHGSTGAGNDHVRFDAVTKALAPKLAIEGLIRDEEHTREEERDFLRDRGHPVSEITAMYSFNFGILGTTIGGEETYGSWEYLPEEAWPTTRSIAEAPDEPAELVITFERGLPTTYEVRGGPDVDVSGTAIGVPGYDTLAALNRIGGTHGVGRGIHTGQTIMGIVGRLGFEAPGMMILIAAHRELERLVLTNSQQTVKASLGTTFGDMLHEGRYYDPLLRDIRAFLNSSQAHVSGDVRVRLHKGNIVALGCRSPYSLLDAGRRLGSTYGHGSSLWTGPEARAYAHIYATAGVLAKSVDAAEASGPATSD